MQSAQVGSGDRGPSVSLATLARGDSAELRIEWAEFKGHRFLSLRQWNRPEGGGDFRPDIKKGITIKKRELSAVIEALTRALELAERDE